jgi:hypothetical protein
MKFIKNFYKRVSLLGWMIFIVLLATNIHDYGLIGTLYSIGIFILLILTAIALHAIDPKNYPKKAVPLKPKLYEEDSHDW